MRFPLECPGQGPQRSGSARRGQLDQIVAEKGQRVSPAGRPAERQGAAHPVFAKAAHPRPVEPEIT